MTILTSRPQEVTTAEYGKLYTDLHDEHAAFLDRYQDYINRSNATINSLCEENRGLKAELAALRSTKITGTFTPSELLSAPTRIYRGTFCGKDIFEVQVSQHTFRTLDDLIAIESKEVFLSKDGVDRLKALAHGVLTVERPSTRVYFEGRE